MSGVYVEVEVDESAITAAGYHHRDDCRQDALERALRSMHEQHHEGPLRLCRQDPCREVSG